MSLNEETYRKAIDVATKALNAARLTMCATNNTLTTDRPDLPRSEETSWTVNFNSEIQLIDDALQAIASTGTGRE